MASKQKTKKRKIHQCELPFDASGAPIEMKPDPDANEDGMFVIEPAMCLSGTFDEPYVKPDPDGEPADGSMFSATSSADYTAVEPLELSHPRLTSTCEGSPAEWVGHPEPGVSRGRRRAGSSTLCAASSSAAVESRPVSGDDGDLSDAGPRVTGSSAVTSAAQQAAEQPRCSMDSGGPGRSESDGPAAGPQAEATCDVCGAQFPSKFHMKVHRQIHTRVLSLPCLNCGKRFPSRDALEKHVHVHAEAERSRRFACDKCGKASFQHSRELLVHMNTAHCDAEPPCCPTCQQTFDSVLLLESHTRTVHKAETEKIFCDICRQYFASKAQFTIHKRTHAGERPFQCDQCRAAFFKKTSLSHHLLQHREQCDVCNAFFGSKLELTRHQLVHNEGGKRIPCDICFKTFAKKSDFSTHYRVHLGDKRFQCQICQRKFSQNVQLTTHSRLHAVLAEDDFEC